MLHRLSGVEIEANFLELLAKEALDVCLGEAFIRAAIDAYARNRRSSSRVRRSICGSSSTARPVPLSLRIFCELCTHSSDCCCRRTGTRFESKLNRRKKPEFFPNELIVSSPDFKFASRIADAVRLAV